jgi:hypothetical protein
MSYLPELRSSLVRAAERKRQPVTDERGRTIASVMAPRRPRLPFGASLRALPTALAVLVAVAIAGLALSVLGHGPPPATGPFSTNVPNPGPAPPSRPDIPLRDLELIYSAQGNAIAADHACSPFDRSVPVMSQGSPSRELLSLLGILRRPPRAADAYARSVFATVTKPTREVYRRYARRARTFSRARFFIVPAGRVDWFRAVPARCIAEERAALQELLRQYGAAPGVQTLQLQAQYLEWQRYHGAHPQGGVCLGAESPMVGAAGPAGTVDCTYAVGDIEQGVASGGPLDSTRGQLFYGVVPDGVATVRVRFSTVNGRRFRPTTAMVVGNVWVIAAPRGAHSPSAWIWRDATGRVLRRVLGPG